MGGIFGGGSNTTTQTSSPPPQVLANYQGLVNRATGVANTPYTPYPGQQVAPLSNMTQTGLGQVGQYAQAAQPYLTQAGQMTQNAAAPVTPTAFSAGQVNQFENPFTQDVVNATQAEFNNQNQQQAQFLNSQNIGAGAFGGDRAGLSQAILAGQQQATEAPVIAGLNQANYNQALAEFNNQQQTGLGAQEFNQGQLGQMASQYGNIGSALQNAGLQGAGQQINLGTVPQAEQQAIDTSMQNTWNQGQAYPFETSGFLGNIIEGVGSESGGTAATTTPGPSALSQIIGAGTAGAGMAANLFGSAAGGTSAAAGIGSAITSALPFLSDVRAKENIIPIGRTFDGQTIHKYNFKGDPRTQIGLLAQEVEHSHPSAVHQGLGGLKHLDYDAATRESERAGFQGGGAAGLGNVSPGQIYDIGVGKQASPAGALALLDPASGAGAGTGRFGAGSLSMTPGGTLFGRGQNAATAPIVAPQWGGTAASPQAPLPAAPMQQPTGPMGPRQAGPVTPQAAHGGRIGHQYGGTAIGGGAPQLTGFQDFGYLDTSTPAAISQGYGTPSNLAGVAEIEYSALTGGATGGSNVPPNAYGQIGTSSLGPSLPNLSGAPPGTTFAPINYQNPAGDFQTAGAENSLAGLIARPGIETKPTENAPPPAAAAPAPAAAAPAPAGPAGLSALNSAHEQVPLINVSGYGHGGPGAGTGGGSGYVHGGRVSFQGGGGLGDVSYYTPTTGNARGATYHPAIPAPTPQPIYIPRHIAPRPAPRAVIPPTARAQAPPTPLPPPRPQTWPDVGPFTPAPSPPPSPPPPPQRNFTAPAPVVTPGVAGNSDNVSGGLYHSLLPGLRGGPFDRYTPDPEDRPGYWNSGGVMGQMPLAGAIGYTPQGQGFGRDSQGKEQGFAGMFGSGMQDGGRIGFQDGGAPSRYRAPPYYLTRENAIANLKRMMPPPGYSEGGGGEAAGEPNKNIPGGNVGGTRPYQQSWTPDYTNAARPPAPPPLMNPNPPTAVPPRDIPNVASTFHSSQDKPGYNETGTRFDPTTNPSGFLSGDQFRAIPQSVPRNVREYMGFNPTTTMAGGGRIGFQDGGGLSGLGMYPTEQSTSQPDRVPANLSALIDAAVKSQLTGRGPGPPQPKGPQQQQQQQQTPGQQAQSLSGSLNKLFANQGGGGGDVLDSLTPSDLADISSGGPDMSGLSSADFADFGLGGIVRPRRGFWDGGADGGDGDGTGTSGPSTGNARGGGGPGPSTGGFGFGGGGGGGDGGGGFGGAVANALGLGTPAAGMTFGTNPAANNSQVAVSFGNDPGPAVGNGPGAGYGFGRGGGGEGIGGGGGGLGETAANFFTHLADLGLISNAQAGELGHQQFGQQHSLHNPAAVITALNRGLGQPGGPSTAPSFGNIGVTQGMLGQQDAPPNISPQQVAVLNALVRARGMGDPGAAGSSAVGTPVAPRGQFGVTGTTPYGSETPGTAPGGPTGLGGEPPGAAVVANPGHAVAIGPGTSQRGGTGGADTGIGANAGLRGGASGVAPTGVGLATDTGVQGGMTGGARNIGFRAHGGRTAFGLGGVARSGFQGGGGLGPGPPEPPEPAFRAPAPAPAAPEAAAPEAAAPASAAVATPKFDSSAFPTNRAETTPAQRDAFNRAYAASIGYDPGHVSGVASAEGLRVGGAGPSSVDVDANGRPYSFGDFQLNVRNGLGNVARGQGIDPADPNQWQKANMFAIDQMKQGGLGPWKTDAYVKDLYAGKNMPSPTSQVVQSLSNSDPETQVHAAMNDAERPPDRKLLPSGFGDSLMAAGFAMMAGTSSHAAVNIGQGALEGMKYMQTQRQLDREWEKNDAQIQDWQSQARYRDAQTGLSVQNMNIEMYKAKLGAYNIQYQAWLAAGGHGDPPPLPAQPASFGPTVSAPTTPTAPTAPAPSVTPSTTAAPTAKPPIPTTPGAVVTAPKKTAEAPPAPSVTTSAPDSAKPPSETPVATEAPPGAPGPNDPFWKNVPPEENPYELNRRAQLYRAGAGINPENSKTADELAARAHAIWDSGMAGGQAIPGVSETKAKTAAQTKYQEGLAEETGKTVAAIPAKMQSRQIVNQRLKEIQDMMGSYTTGAWAEEKADLAAKAAAVFGRDFVPETWMKDAATFQRMVKDQILNTMDNVKAMGGRPMVTEIESLKRAMAGPEMQPGAAAAIIAQARGILKWQDDHDNALSDWADQNPREFKTAKFENQFNKDHPLDNYVTEARHNFAYQGQTIPADPGQREKGQAYMTPKGPRVWTGTGWGAFTPPAQ